MGMKSLETVDIAAIAIMSALTLVCTSFSVSFAPTGGYFNLGDVIVVTTALLFGPIVGGIAGGLGSALADMYLGYGAFAPFTLVVKGIEGLVVGYIAGRKDVALSRIIIAWLIGGLIIIIGYWVSEVFFLGVTPAAATTEALTINVLQAIVSGLGIPLSNTIKKRLTI
jgi:uncharacterized membrane protein